MSNAAVAYYAAQVRQLALSIYCTHGEHVGHVHARAAIRTTAEVLAEMAGREKAVALLDELSAAVLSQTKLLDMPALLAPTPPIEPPKPPTPQKVSLRDRLYSASFLYGTLFGYWLCILVRAVSK
jgi:hypothetical protein